MTFNPVILINQIYILLFNTLQDVWKNDSRSRLEDDSLFKDKRTSDILRFTSKVQKSFFNVAYSNARERYIRRYYLMGIIRATRKAGMARRGKRENA